MPYDVCTWVEFVHPYTGQIQAWMPESESVATSKGYTVPPFVLIEGFWWPQIHHLDYPPSARPDTGVSGHCFIRATGCCVERTPPPACPYTQPLLHMPHIRAITQSSHAPSQAAQHTARH